MNLNNEIETLLLELNNIKIKLSELLPYDLNLTIESTRQKQVFNDIDKILKEQRSEDQIKEAIRILKSYPDSINKFDLFNKHYDLIKKYL